MKRLFLVAVLLAISLCSAASAAPDIDYKLYFVDSYTQSDKTAEAQKIFPNCVWAVQGDIPFNLDSSSVFYKVSSVDDNVGFKISLYLKNRNGSFDRIFERNSYGTVFGWEDIDANSEHDLVEAGMSVYAVLCIDVVDRTAPLLDLKSQQYTDGNPLPSLASVEPYRSFSLGFDVKNFEKHTVSGTTGGEINSSFALNNGNGKMSVSSFLAAGQNGIITIAAESANGKRASFDIVLSADTSVPHIPVTDIKLKDSSDPSALPAGKITLTLSGDIAEQRKIEAVLAPENATYKYVTWSSDKPTVASVDQDGTISALKAGTATITATARDGGSKATCEVTVEKNDIFVLDPIALSLAVGEEKKVTAFFKSEAPQWFFVTWKIADPETVTEVWSWSDYCTVRGLREGSTQLTATTTGPDGETLTATCDITVTDSAQPSVTIDLSELGLYNDTMDVWEGDTVALWISGTPSGLTFSAEGLPQGLTLSPQGHLYGTIPTPAAGEYPIKYYTVTIKAKTASDESASESFTLAVKTPDDSGSSDSGGCNAGFAGLALSLAGLLCLKKSSGR